MSRGAGSLLALAGSGALLLFALAGAARDASVRYEPPGSWRVPAGDPSRGAQLAQTCLACHGADATPTDPPAPRLLHQRPSYFFTALTEYRDGRRSSSYMEPVAKGLSDQDIRDLAAYLLGDMLDRPPRAHTEMPIYRRTTRDCTWCHGETGIGEMEGLPVLAGQEPAYLVHALEAYRSGARTSPVMRGVVRDIAPQDDRAFADYYGRHAWLERNK